LSREGGDWGFPVGASKSSLSSLHASTFFSATCCREKKKGKVNAIAIS
jgi:hypothetical protein